MLLLASEKVSFPVASTDSMITSASRLACRLISSPLPRRSSRVSPCLLHHRKRSRAHGVSSTFVETRPPNSTRSDSESDSCVMAQLAQLPKFTTYEFCVPQWRATLGIHRINAALYMPERDAAGGAGIRMSRIWVECVPSAGETIREKNYLFHRSTNPRS